MEYRHGNHSVYGLQYHIVLVTKYRKGCIDGKMKECLVTYIKELIEGMNGHVIEANADQDHVHILTELSPKLSVQDMIGVLKGCTSRRMKKLFSDELGRFYHGDRYSFWSDSYFISTTGGTSLDIIREYVEQQGQPKRPKGRPRRS